MSDLDVLRMFAAEKHPRAPKGSDVGGEFAPAKQSGKGPKTGAAKTTGHGQQATHHDSGTLSYDGKTGTGYGSKNGDARVHKLQEALNRLGITDSAGKRLVDDGKLGPKTTSAVKAAQKRLGLPVDGKVTPAFLAKLASTKAPPHRSAPMLQVDERAQMTSKAINDLPDSDFAYIEPGGTKDASGRTIPRDLRHFPIHDEAHVRNALSRIGRGAEFGDKAMPKVKAAAKRMGIEVNTGGRSRLGLDVCLRAFDFEPAEARSGGDGRTLEGYAAVFNRPTKIRDLGGDFEETIFPGAFKRTLGERTPLLQWDHGKDPRIGTAPIGDIQDLREDDHGLYVRAKLYDHPDIERVRLAIAGRSIKGMSFRFGVPEGGDEWPSRDKRNVRDLDAYELGPVAFPAYDTTSVTVRSLLAQLDPVEHRVLIRELAAEVRLAMDLTELAADDGGPEDLTGVSDAWRADRGDSLDTEPGHGAASPMHLRQRLDDGALRARGILK